MRAQLFQPGCRFCFGEGRYEFRSEFGRLRTNWPLPIRKKPHKVQSLALQFRRQPFGPLENLFCRTHDTILSPPQAVNNL